MQKCTQGREVLPLAGDQGNQSLPEEDQIFHQEIRGVVIGKIREITGN